MVKLKVSIILFYSLNIWNNNQIFKDFEHIFEKNGLHGYYKFLNIKVKII